MGRSVVMLSPYYAECQNTHNSKKIVLHMYSYIVNTCTFCTLALHITENLGPQKCLDMHVFKVVSWVDLQCYSNQLVIYVGQKEVVDCC